MTFQSHSHRIEEAEAARRRTGAGPSEDLLDFWVDFWCDFSKIARFVGILGYFWILDMPLQFFTILCTFFLQISNKNQDQVALPLIFENPRASSGCWRNRLRSEYHGRPGVATQQCHGLNMCCDPKVLLRTRF